MLKTCMTKKLEEMKNGGYALFSDKARKILVTMGLSLISIGTFSQVANAEVSATITHKREIIENNQVTKVRYLINLEESDDNNKLDGIYLSDGVTKITPEVGKISGKDAKVVIELPSNESEIVVKNDKVNGDDDVDVKHINLETCGAIQDQDGPEIEKDSLIKCVYNNEQQYIQAKFKDAVKIYKIEDQNGHARALIKEKDKENEIVLKYILEPGDTFFTIYDILGNSTLVSLADEIKINVEYNSRNINGTKITLRLTKEFEEDNIHYTLKNITTGAGENVIINEDDNNDIYTNIPVGTTKLRLIYQAEIEGVSDKIFELPLILDKDAPVVVAYKKTAEEIGYLMEESKEEIANARAYFNKDKAKGIVEVKDIQSGIAMIKTLKGETDNYEEEQIIEAYKSNRLQSSILCLFPVTQDTTAVRVYDGVENTIDIPLGLANQEDAITVATIMKQKDGTYKLIAQDVKTGLGKIERDGEVQDLANFEDEEGTTIDGVNYEQYTLKRLEMTVNDQGNPIIHIYDALGNQKQLSFDEFAYMCHYATYNTTDSLAISVEDSRGISKITVTMVDLDAGDEPIKLEEPQSPRLDSEPILGEPNYNEKKAIWDAWKEYDEALELWEEWNEEYRHTYTLEVFGEQEEPQELTKTYPIPEGIVEEVRVYNTKEDDNLYNVIKDELINVSRVKSVDRIKTSSEDITVDDEENPTQIVGAKIKAKYGIKQVRYADGCVLQFYDELPTELYVNCLIADEDNQSVFVGAVVTDALGDTLTIESDRVIVSYNDNEINI